jgi:hypothetical protein
MTILRVNPKLDFAANLRLNGIDPADYIRDYNVAIANVYLDVTEGSGDISVSTVSSPATRGGSRYRKLNTTRRLKGGNQKKSRPILKTVCVIAMVLGLAAVVYSLGESHTAQPIIEAAESLASQSHQRFVNLSEKCDSKAILQAAANAGSKAVSEWGAGWIGALRQLGNSSFGGPGAGMAEFGVRNEAVKLTTYEIETQCNNVYLAAQSAASDLLVLQGAQAQVSAIGAAGLCAIGLGSFVKARISKNKDNINTTTTAKPAPAPSATSKSAPASLANFDDLDEQQSGGGPKDEDDDILIFDTTTPENIMAMIKAQSVFLAGEKMKAATARSILSLVGAAESVTSIAGQELPSDPIINAPKQGGAIPAVSYIETKKTLLMLGILPGVVDEILSRSTNPSLSKPVNANI